MSEDVYLNLLSRYVSNELSLEETEVLLQWIGDDPKRENLLRDFQETWDLTKNYPESFKVDTSSAWLKLRHSIKDVTPPPAMHTIPVKKWMAIIAAFILLIIFLLMVFKYFVIR